MPLYTVFAPPPKPGETAPDPVRFVFVKDGFCWPALFIPELWLLFRRMWLVFLLYLGVSVVVSIVAAQVGGPLPWVFLALMRLLFALEGNALRRWKLTSLGYTFVGVAEGRREAAEVRFFSEWQPPLPLPVASEPPPTGGRPAEELSTGTGEAAKPIAPATETGTVVGLFPAPGGAT